MNRNRLDQIRASLYKALQNGADYTHPSLILQILEALLEKDK